MKQTEHELKLIRKKRSNFALLVGIVGLFLIAGVTVKYLSQIKKINDKEIAAHIDQLQTIFKKINDSCKITSFRKERNDIDFLNVITFAGSTVGSMNLEKPENWQGSYLTESLTIEGKEYQIIETEKGYYIIPGDGVKLANERIIGKTLRIENNSDIDAMMRDPQQLLSQNKPLAAKIETYSSPYRKEVHTTLPDIKTVSTY